MAVLEACYDDGLWLVMDTLDAGELVKTRALTDTGSHMGKKLNVEHGKESKITLTTYRITAPLTHAPMPVWAYILETSRPGTRRGSDVIVKKKLS